MPRVARRASTVFLVGGLLVLGYAGYVVVDARLYQTRELERLQREPRAAIEAAASASVASLAAAMPRPADGTAIGQLEIPRLGVSVLVVQGESAPILQRAVGHLARTALPGEEGNVALAGHRDTFFRPLKDITEGDRITLKMTGRVFSYVVESTSVVKPNDVSVLQPVGGHTLTLITCFPFYFVGSAPSRFIVFAREEKGEDPQESPKVR